MPEICGIYSAQPLPPAARATVKKMLAAIQPTHETALASVAHEHFVATVCYAPGSREAELRRDDFGELVCVGEIYDSDPPLAEKTVGAAIAALWYQHREEWPQYANGIFAGVHFNGMSRRLVLTTDHFGVCPILYAPIGELLLFATRLQAIAASGLLSREILPNAIYHYLLHHMIPTPHTIYRGAHKLPPGSMALMGPEEPLQIRKYWDMHFVEDDSRKWPEMRQEIVQSLMRSVKQRQFFNVNGCDAGAFLSGGTDSSTVAGMMARQSAQPVPAFSIGFNEDYYNEMNYAELAAQHFSLQHFKHAVSPAEALSVMPKLIAAFDEPFGNSSIIPTYFCAKLAKDHGVPIMLAGDGGDELFGGNKRYAEDKIFQHYTKLPRALRTHVLEPALENLPPALAIGPLGKTQRYVNKAKLSVARRSLSFVYYDMRQLLAADYFAALDWDEPLRQADQLTANCNGASQLNQYLYLDLKYTITDNDLRKVNRMCQAAGVRVRYPYLDRRVVSCSSRLPSFWKVRHRRLRHGFKEAFKDFLPAAIIAKKKHGFGVPICDWLRRDPSIWQFSRDILLDQQAKARGYFQNRFIEKLFDLHDRDSTPYFGTVIWQLLALEIWMRAHEDNN